MKKLLITSMAAVAIGLCAKAEFTANESFEKNAQDENLAEGPFFPVDDETGNYIYGLDWTSEATPEDGIFTVTNITKITTEGDSYPTDRPLSGDNVKALAIDTEKSLIRKVISSASDQLEGASLVESEGGAPIFFDSVVQFTATETAPETTGAKLVAWLYKTEDLAEGEKGLFGETDPISKLVLTALYDGLDGLIETNYLTDVTIQPESWHRLTIKSFVQDDLLQFEVKVDGDIVKVNGVQVPFISLDEKGTKDKTLKGVAFEGKGVVDDLVFTTTDPFDEDDPVVQNFTIKLSEADEFWDVSDRKYSIDNGEFVAVPNDMSVLIPTGSKKVKFAITMGGAGDGEEYTITAKLGETVLTVEKDNVNKVCNFEIDVENTAANVELLVSYTVVKVGGSGGSDVEYPTVVPEVGVELTIPLSSEANTAIEDAFAGMTVDAMPEKLTVVINEQEYKNDAAIQMINDVVDMFELSDGDKYFDNNGLMKVSFKATNPLLDAETADAEDYEAKVGEAIATVRDKYTVEKQDVDLTPDVSGENEPVIFKLVIKPAVVQ